MDQKKRAAQFATLHVKGSPVVLYNAWDAGSAKAVVDAGGKAIATGSWSVAAAQGYEDGEDIPKEFVEQIAARIAHTVNVPVTVDFEGGYSENDRELANNVSRLLEVGVIGINFEDRVVKGKGLYAIDRQARRIAAIREAAEKKGIPLFINARTDLFLGEGDDDPAKSIDEALERARAYAAAGASGFFIPGLTDAKLIETICKGVSLPVNVMVMDGVPSNKRLSGLGVARISYGPIPYVEAMDALQKAARKVLS
jgi:2-methylisocitrate lyase-like PEP mutase family enzyme